VEDKIKKIFKKYAIEHNGTSLAEDGVPPFVIIDVARMSFIFEDLLSLIKSTQREGIKQFAKWCDIQDGDLPAYLDEFFKLKDSGYIDKYFPKEA